VTRAFPDGFDWGTATAAHQIEGGNWNNDWWEWEHNPDSGCVEPSGDACDSWNRWPDDVALVSELGLGSYRFSIEWSRIEPEEGEWSRAAVDHYRRIGEALREAGVVPVVTFHHFTTPRWLSARGGWMRESTVDAFARFCERAACELAPVLGRACTINEPNIVAVMGYLMGMFPPGATELDDARRVIELMCGAHRRAVEAIRSSAPGVPVGLTLSMTDYQPVDGGEATAQQTRVFMEDPFLDVTEGDDFIGVQAYSRMLVGPRGPVGNAPDSIVLPMGYEYWPEALEAVVRRVAGRLGEARGGPVGGAERADPAGTDVLVERLEKRADRNARVVAVEEQDVDHVAPERPQAGLEVGRDRLRRDAAAQLPALGRAQVVAGLRDDDRVRAHVPEAPSEHALGLAVGARRVEGVAAQLEPPLRQRARGAPAARRPGGRPEDEPGEVAAERLEPMHPHPGRPRRSLRHDPQCRAGRAARATALRRASRRTRRAASRRDARSEPSGPAAARRARSRAEGSRGAHRARAPSRVTHGWLRTRARRRVHAP